MDAPLVTVQKLIGLALNPGAGVEESRNAALAAIRIIHRHNLLSTTPPRKRVRKPKNPEPVQVMSREEIRLVAESKADLFVAFLVKKAILGKFPCFSSRAIAEQALQDGKVHSANRHVFFYYLKQALSLKVKQGILRAKSGSKGGYHLITLKQEQVA